MQVARLRGVIKSTIEAIIQLNPMLTLVDAVVHGGAIFRDHHSARRHLEVALRGECRREHESDTTDVLVTLVGTGSRRVDTNERTDVAADAVTEPSSVRGQHVGVLTA